MPLHRRLPKRGFNNIFRTEYAIVNLDSLSVFNDGDVVDIDAVKAKGIIKKPLAGLKVLGDGEITKKLTIKAAKFSETAKSKIEAAGGKAETL